MRYYAKFSFYRSPLSDNSYILSESKGKVKGLFFQKYAETPGNKDLGISGKEYIYFGVPRNPSIRRFFAHTFEGLNHKPITSTEAINEKERTFGDAKQLSLPDLILFQFSEERSKLEMWFVKDKGYSRLQKQECFLDWNNGEELIPAN